MSINRNKRTKSPIAEKFDNATVSDYTAKSNTKDRKDIVIDRR